MAKSLKTIAAVFTLAAGIAFGVAAADDFKAGHTTKGIAEDAFALVSLASGGLGLLLRRFGD
jgi:uncharacterized membrane protein YsdA (DUF1294 family)